MNERELLKNDCNNVFVDSLSIIQYIISIFIVVGGLTLLLIFIIFYMLQFLPLIANLFIVFFLFATSIFLYNSIHSEGERTRILINQANYFDDNQDHHAVIITHKRKSNENGKYLFADYAGGIEIVINSLKNHNPPIPFRIYESDKVQDVIDIIKNPHSTFLWIFGHGQRNKLFLVDGQLCYFLVRDAPKKEFIGQYHCSSLIGNSLADYLKPQNQDISNWFRFPITMRWAVRRKLIEMGITPLF